MIRDSRLHRWSHAQRFVNPAEIVMHVVERDSRSMVLKLLAVPVREPRKTAHAHSHREVLALNERC